MKILELCHTVTAKGHFFYINGKRVTREAWQLAKFQRRMDCFITRVDQKAVRNFVTVYA